MNAGTFTQLGGKPDAAPRRIQRACDCGGKSAQGGECEECKKKKLQRRVDGTATTPTTGTAAAGAHVDHALAGGGQALEPGARGLLESRFGADFSRVRVHTDGAADASARALGAQAYATGEHLVFGAGRYAPHTRGGLWLLAHELAHTVQQRLGGPAAQARAEAPDSPADPSEAAANRAADAVLAGQSMPRLAPASGGLHCYKVTSVDTVNDSEKLVHLDSGLRYRVYRSSEIVVRERLHDWAGLKPGADKERVWLEVEWCANKNHGSLRFSGDVPKQVANALVGAVTQGKDVKAIIKDARITPRVDLKMLQSGDFSLSVNGEVTLDMNGKPTGFSGGAKLSKGPFDFGVKVEPGKGPDDKPQGVQGTLNIEVTPGRKDKKEDCRREKRSVVEIPHFRCETERDIPAHDKPIQVAVTDRETRTIYFDYATDGIDAGRSATDLESLGTLLGTGFQVTNVAGFTSPEGPLEPNKKFIGNKALAQARAVAAARKVQAACPQATAEDAKAGPTAGACFVSGAQAAGAADPELYTRVVVDESGKVTEVEGTPLAEAAVGDFMASPDEAEAGRRTPEVEQAVAKKKTPAGKAGVVYPLLRRAVITLERHRMAAGKKHVDASVQTDPSACPDDVVEAAFGAGALNERTLKDK
jgi:hypothetical protein